MPDVNIAPENAGQRVSEWALDADAGQIHAFDEQGRVLMAIATGPLFGPRLAAAFGWPSSPASPTTSTATPVGPPPRMPR